LELHNQPHALTLGESSSATLQSLDTTVGQQSPFLLEIPMHYDLQHCDITIQEHLFVKEGHKNVHFPVTGHHLLMSDDTVLNKCIPDFDYPTATLLI
jgi:hypothetical protein